MILFIKLLLAHLLGDFVFQPISWVREKELRKTIGLLIAAKSVFRFNDLKKSQDRKLTEYILIGTLLSFTSAIITAIVISLILLFGIATDTVPASFGKMKILN